MRATAKRFNIYSVIHKYARVEIAALVKSAGNTELHRASSRQKFTDKFNKVKHFLDTHSEREDQFIHPLLETTAPALLQTAEKQHRELDDQMEALDQQLGRIANPEDSYVFYLDLTGFQANYSQHLLTEETELLPALHKHYDDKELLGVNGQILQSISKEDSVTITRGMLPVITHGERVDMYGGMKRSMPKGPFTGMCRLVVEALSPSDAQKLFRDIKLSEEEIEDLMSQADEKSQMGIMPKLWRPTTIGSIVGTGLGFWATAGMAPAFMALGALGCGLTGGAAGAAMEDSPIFRK